MEPEVKKKFIEIKGKPYALKRTWAAMFEIEDLTKERDQMGSLKYASKMFYIFFKAGGNDMTYEQFMELINDDFDLLNKVTDVMQLSEGKKTADQ